MFVIKLWITNRQYISFFNIENITNLLSKILLYSFKDTLRIFSENTCNNNNNNNSNNNVVVDDDDDNNDDDDDDDNDDDDK